MLALMNGGPSASSHAILDEYYKTLYRQRSYSSGLLSEYVRVRNDVGLTVAQRAESLGRLSDRLEPAFAEFEEAMDFDPTLIRGEGF
jgi:hypothetical protein